MTTSGTSRCSASARDNAQLADTARQGVGILGPDTPAAARLANIARFLDFVGESITRAAEQAREILYARAETTSGGVGGQPVVDGAGPERASSTTSRTASTTMAGE